MGRSGGSQREKQPERPGSKAGAGNGKQYCLNSHKEHGNDTFLCSLSFDNVTSESMEIPGTVDWKPERENFPSFTSLLPFLLHRAFLESPDWFV